jgi:antitoxin PrlF
VGEREAVKAPLLLRIGGKADLPYNEAEDFAMSTLTVTAKGQITLNKDVLRHLNVAPGQKVEVEKLPGGRLTLRPASRKGSIAAFSGSLAKKGTPRLTIEQIDEAIADGWAGKR